MDTTRLFVVGAVLVTVLALALGAPTLADLSQDDESDGSGEGSPAAQADEQPGDGPELDAEDEDSGTGDAGSLAPIIVVGLLMGIALALALLYGFGPGRMLRVFVVIAVMYAVFLVLSSQFGAIDIPFLPDDPEVLGEVGLGDETGDGADETAGDGSDGETRDFISSLVVSAGTLLVLLAGVFLGVAVLYYYLGDGDSGETGSEDSVDVGERSVTPASLGDAAGRALRDADGTAAGNSIYEAWVEMTGELDVENRPVRTPAEFEEVAVDAGMNPTHVEELTDLFRVVRYGQTPVSEAREREARDLLDRIQRTYGTGSDGGRGDE